MSQLRQHNNILLLSCKESLIGLVGIDRLSLYVTGSILSQAFAILSDIFTGLHSHAVYILLRSSPELLTVGIMTQVDVVKC